MVTTRLLPVPAVEPGRRPRGVEIVRLPAKFPGFIATDADEQRRRRFGDVELRALALDDVVREQQLRLYEAVAQRSQVEQAADRDAALDDVRGQSVVTGPVRCE